MSGSAHRRRAAMLAFHAERGTIGGRRRAAMLAFHAERGTIANDR
jgi:hypothetical protein